MHHQTYFNQLKLYTLAQKNKESVENINYGDELTGAYLDIYNEAMAQVQVLLNALLSKRKMTEIKTELN